MCRSVTGLWLLKKCLFFSKNRDRLAHSGPKEECEEMLKYLKLVLSVCPKI